MITKVKHQVHTDVNHVARSELSDELRLGYLAVMAYNRLDVTPNKFESVDEYIGYLMSNVNPAWEYRINAQSQETLRQMERLGRTIMVVGVLTPVQLLRSVLLVSNE